jgi:N-acetylneuraminic acid mutarotase
VSGDVPLARDGHSACVVNDKMYIFGGFEEAYERFTQDLYCLDLRTMIWKLIRHMVRPHF